MNGSFIILVKENVVRKFFMFLDGDVRETTHGLGELIDYYEFKKIYNDLISNGYKEETKVTYRF